MQKLSRGITLRIKAIAAGCAVVGACFSGSSNCAIAGSKPIDWDKKLAKERQLTATNNVEEAIKILEEFEKKHPEAGPVHTDMGKCLKLRGKLSAAKAEFRRSTEVDANYAEAWYELGAMQESDKEWDMAVASYERYLAIAPYSERKDSVKDRINFCKSKL
jgi:tetratricopeptide (TPR) repeat protein